MRSWSCFGLLLPCMTCGGKHDAPKQEGPIRIAFGDCTITAMPFVSGPRPAVAKAPRTATRTPDRKLLPYEVDATPMKIVNRVLDSVHAAGGDFVLAAQRAGTWQPLRPVVAPVVPVPVGTVGSWNGAAHEEEGEASVALSLYLQKDGLWLGVSQLDQFIHVEGRDWGKFEQALRDHKATSRFLDRVDVEIAADDDVAYAELVHVIEVATKVGFTEWAVTDRSGLSVVPSL